MKRIVGAVALLFAFAVHTLSQSALQFTAVRATDERAIHLEWASQSNHVYQVQCADQLAGNDDGTTAWQTLYDNYPSQGTNTFWLDTGNYFQTPPIPRPSKSPVRFCRIMDKGPDDLVGDEPAVSITTPTNGLVASGLLTVSVTATTDQGSVEHRLYVDGQEMWPSGDGTNYVINTCEWGNGPHVLFATARSSTAVDGPANSFGLTGHAVSPFVPVVFSNLVTRISFSEPFFQPALGQTQQVSAVFAANSDWALAIEDVYSNTVRTATGSGSSMQFSWDGTGNGGTNIPDGVYYYYISAQTNGQALVADPPPGGGGEGAPPQLGMSSTAAATTSSDSLFPASAPQAIAAGLDYSYLPLPPMPPVYTNGEWVPWEHVYGPTGPAWIDISDPTRQRLPRSLPTAAGSIPISMDGPSPGDPDPAGYSGASSEAAPPAPQRPPTTPSKGTVGKIAVAYQMYNANGTNPVYAAPILDNSVGLRTFVQMQGNSGTVSLPYAPFREVDMLAVNFMSEMKKGSWGLERIKADDSLAISDLRGSGTFFNDADLGLLIVHGTYGTSFDSTPGRQVKQMYFPIASGGGAQYLRMSEMRLGGSSPTNGLKWMALMACTSLYQQNWNSMKSQGVKPYNGNLHMILGCATDFAAEPLIGKLWADYMLGIGTNIFTGQSLQPMKIRDAWYAAANDAYKKIGSLITVPNPTVMAVVADSNCTEDSLPTNSVPAGGTWNYYNNRTVYPPQ